LKGNPVEIDLYRRNLQRSYLDVIKNRLGSESVNGETRSLLRGNLQGLETLVNNRADQTSDNATRHHLNDVSSQINLILKAEKG
ncbi:MAG: hypothetical protein WD491_14470, partial [Balneolales bacterium]